MAGDTLELKFMHKIVGDRAFAVKSDEDIIFQTGGYNKERQKNGNLTGHPKMTAVAWMLEGLQVATKQSNGDQQYLQKISNHPDDANITWQHKDGYIYSMVGSTEGEIKYNSNSGYTPLSLSGDGEAKPIA